MNEKLESYEELKASLERMKNEIEDNLVRLDRRTMMYSHYQDKRFDKLESYYKSLLLLTIDKAETHIPKTPDDILKDIRTLGELERKELLSELYYLYFNEKNLPRSEIFF